MDKDAGKKTGLSEKDEYYQKVMGASERPLLVVDKNEVKNNLTGEIEKLARLVAEESNSIALTRDCDKLLDQARTLLSRETPDTESVSSKLDKVKRRLLVAYESKKTWPKWILILFSINGVYLFIIGFLIGWYALIPGQKNLESTTFVCLACALWGGLGGVIDAFSAIYTHSADQDFDLHYRTWYFVHPIQGAALGAVIYLVIQAGLLAITGNALEETATANITGAISQEGGTSKIGATALPIVMAFLAGFKQNKARNFLTRIVSSIFEKSSKDEAEE